MFTAQDVRNASQVCVLGQTLAQALFGDQSPLGSDVRLNHQPFRVIGVLSPKGANMIGIDQDDILLAPWTAIKFKVAGRSVTPVNQSENPVADATAINTLNQRYPSRGVSLFPVPSASQQANNPRIDRVPSVNVIWARVRLAEDIPAAKQQITEVLRRQHRLRTNLPNDFTLRDMTEQNNVLGSTSQLMSGLLLSVALISLLVGGVGIMNIMLVSVTERTREIGLRMAVGARPRDILRQFLVEAVLLCLLGGGLGIAVGRAGSETVRIFLRWPTQVSPEAMIASVGVSALVGIVFGYYPAWKASRLDPIQALRYE
jgi:ABC-type antimicrobial peptide transport system permease subunit